MRGTEEDLQYEKMTATPVSRLIFTLSIPSVISMLVNNIYNLVDTAFVGRLGTSASGAVGVVFGFMAVIQESASRFASMGFFASMGCGLLIALAGFLFLGDIVMLLGSTETIAPYAKTYISYILAAAPFMCGSLTLNNILRYEGKAALGMVGLMTGAVLNMAGDPILMFGFHMGIAGAGLSTALSQIVSWGILLFMFLSGKTESRISIRNVGKGDVSQLFNIMATGFPSLLRQGLNSFNTVLLNSQCAAYGDAAVAGMSIVSRIIFFAFSIALGIGQGFQPVSAFNYGAGKYGRIRKGFRFTAAAAEGIIFVGCAVLFLFSEELVAVFRDDPEVVAVGARALRLQALANLLLPFCMTTEMLFQSTGKRLGASLLSAFRNGLLFIPLILLLPRFRGLAGIQEAQPRSSCRSLPRSFSRPGFSGGCRKGKRQKRAEREPDSHSAKFTRSYGLCGKCKVLG